MPYIVIFLLILSGMASASEKFLPQAQAVPGGVAIVEVGNANLPKPQYIYKRDNLAVVEKDGFYFAIVGIALGAKVGKHYISHKQTGKKVPFIVKDYAYREQWLTIKNTRKVNPNQQDMTRINSERSKIWRAKNQFRRNIEPTFSMQLPIKNHYLSSGFGLKRFFNKQPRRPHGGLDIAAPRHTPIYAPADGKVVEAHNFFFSGNCVFIEHGMGLTTFYAHMHSINVKPGQMVKTGDLLGTVGDTGRVTGPHLHWSVGLNGNWVNPKLFVADIKSQLPKDAVVEKD